MVIQIVTPPMTSH